MTVHLSLDTYLFSIINPKSLWWKQRNKYPYLYRPKVCWRINHAIHPRVFHTSEPQCKWARSRTFWYNKYIYSHEFLYYRVSKLLTSSSKGLTKVNNRMSRIKNTIESVSKAVSGTHSELVSRIARLKSHSGTLGKANKSNADASNIHANLENDKQVTDARTQEDCNRGPAAKKSTCANENLEPILVSASGTDQDTENDSASTKTHLFHVSYFSTNFGETYNFVADHINWYFNNSVMDQEKKRNGFLRDSQSEERNKLDSSENTIMSEEKTVDSAATSAPEAETLGAEKTNAALPVSTKKSIANFLSYPSNSVQAFVDSYIGGLVPKLRSDTKVVSPEKSKQLEQEVSEKDEEDKAKEAKTAEEREKHLSLQREKIIARVSIDNRTRALVQALRRSSNRRVCISRVEELTYHLLEFPESRGVAIKEKLIPCLLRLRQANDESLQAAVRETLAIIGYTDPVKGWGIRVLAIDGGGTRGLVALQTLRKLEELTGKPVHQLFDYICGVSTGAILAFMLGLFHIPLDDCEELYRKLGSDVFKQNVIVGTVKMGWSHAFYDSDIWEKMLKEKMGSNLMIETARNSKCPKVAAVSTIVNRGTPLKAFVFRNYNHFPGVKSHYIGGCQYKLWQAIRASSAAPGYFQEYVLGNDLHQDGGLLLNNPSALAVHECKCLWPNVPLQCLVSLGTGRYESEGKTNVTYTSLKAKLTNVISSATDTEEVHTMLDALLPPDTYFRFNPLMNEDIPLDESRKEKLNQLQTDGIRYLERNEEKLRKAAKILTQEKTTLQRLQDWIRLKADMYEGLPFLSKL
ncbi:calcium-independent phospholipase A2-gamma [Haliaeetus albicilla]|uniref:calcium-independent phospholipase A2-gamma n=1 Tax=Haliaeetus albicilla TaxID=8969 RepID=UPI000522B6F5|nr:PREDICTED: calcium-independent phospholipase A2-gamma isoform X1 [Haliaeetus albicilla]XP_009925496.1 PREDICTED: calcium-independent phospholipase A2-gamma isoform X1 [Haliaeetus albicilla]XP_009925497.1 PREDICTED: calcium-independent phospholipase A2-gamma isoform X1 [Haliaeetus albicilla]XP_010572339.1 PREDICTED: calcium-independent phospholipase A2-gamma isoform X1 [Haliaeetus leucocephalus]XP_010572340.1 PREDICTED: calcium-independent phospholipase A2-gamma isoform X1 [Haliaeetus leucoce